MPHSIVYRPDLVDNLVTVGRLDSYQHVFMPADDVELLGVYLWNVYTCGQILPLVGAAEIALRNSMDSAIRAQQGTYWWKKGKLRYASFAPATPPPFPVKAVQDNFDSATAGFKRDLRNRYNITGRILPDHNKIVAKTEFSTWEFLLDQEFMGPTLIWPYQLTRVFKGPWGTHNAGSFLGHIADLVKVVREFRNRLFHHEPAWKRFGVQTEADALAHLLEKIAKIEDLIRFIHPEKLRLLEAHGLVANAKRACTAHEIARFKQHAKTHKIDSIRRLTDLVKEASQDNKVLHGDLRNRGIIITPR